MEDFEVELFCSLIRAAAKVGVLKRSDMEKLTKECLDRFLSIETQKK